MDVRSDLGNNCCKYCTKHFQSIIQLHTTRSAAVVSLILLSVLHVLVKTF